MLIVGTGFAGLAMAIRLQEAGFGNLLLIEKAAEVGGTWRENTYPGAACDIPSHLYSLSFAPKSDWSRLFPRQPELYAYLRDVADRFSLRPLIRFGTALIEARWDEARSLWVAATTTGTIEARVLVGGMGPLHWPSIPDLPGVEAFAGPRFHSATWRHDLDLAGKRVAVIGTGASAIQFIPEIAKVASHVTVFQRTPPWVIPKFDTDYSPVQHRIFARVPGMLSLERLGWWSIGEFVSLGLVEFPAIARLVTWIAERHLRKQVEDPRLRAVLTPDYPIGCKRALFSNDYYPALTRPNVRVETAAITEITPDGPRTADGVVHPVDVIIYGTGFKGTEFLWPMRILGRNERQLADTWADGAHAHYGITVPGFPNLFMVYGPNTNLGVGSIVYMIESQARYIRQAVRLLAEHPGSYLEVRDGPEREFNTALQKRLDRTPWNFCGSWYRTASGRITNNWPGTVTSYRRRTRRLKPDDFALTPAG
ncbi:NAD(P)/FAD-dependent oxidoreductase [Nocardia sp.]|uniref:flavin-containing monooxygenase n=1 Tax=Nocardia sp. TaxID=1821 RepID=UPI00258AC9DD|nr:NAD(P)/FAD-dependent oxidoreductase [Nocardia sp.]